MLSGLSKRLAASRVPSLVNKPWVLCAQQQMFCAQPRQVSTDSAAVASYSRLRGGIVSPMHSFPTNLQAPARSAAMAGVSALQGRTGPCIGILGGLQCFCCNICCTPRSNFGGTLVSRCFVELRWWRILICVSVWCRG